MGGALTPGDLQVECRSTHEKSLKKKKEQTKKGESERIRTEITQKIHKKD